MQRMILAAVLAALTLFAGCAPRDPNLALRGMGEFPRKAGDYTLSVATYELDADGRARLAQKADASLTGFVTRSLAPKGYVLKSSGPARYALEVHLLCGNIRTADKGILGEALSIPAELVAGHSGQVHYWLPDKESFAGTREAQDTRDTMVLNRVSGGPNRDTKNPLGGAPLGRTTPDACQGRVLVVVTQAGAGSTRESFVARAATEDCRAVSGCPVNVCRSALEQSLVDILERRF